MRVTIYLSILFFFSLIANFTFSQTQPKKALTKNENFLIFLETFSESKDFQKKRVSSICKDCEITNDGDTTCRIVQNYKWLHVKLIKEGSVSRIYNNFLLKEADTNERVFSFEQIEGPATYYFFKRINGLWFLVKRLSYND